MTSPRRALAARLGSGFAGINAAAMCAAVEFGIQPALFHTADRTPLYAPFDLAQTIPAMAARPHLTVAGFVEGGADVPASSPTCPRATSRSCG
jgi:cobalt/nickel transport system permease protein